ncbi:RNA-directed DNA polymerase from transposon BS [Paramuricea clavata]|uniref:RNA-directed DNA polymerase from transposon BS n=1 Tax=Paramuricea clavata TaxID=317549 RepID=A0A7D9J972_PARCT|nr:RNA-directed DNA polymerase from transposon BS [Paramuricea clavata]
MRPFVEKYGHRLTSSGHLSETIPLSLDKEKETLKTDISDGDEFSVMFDGSCRLGEVLAIVLRYIDTRWNIQQRLLKLETLAKSLKSQELAQRLIHCLAVEFSVHPELILCATKDSAAVNEAALNQVKFYFSNLFSITCFNHVIDNAGKKFQFRILDTFIRHWNSMFSQSPAVRLAWKTKTGKVMRTTSATRGIEDLAPALHAHLLEIFDSPEDVADFKLEIADLIDALDGFAQIVQLGAYPNCTALSRERANGNQVIFNQLLERVKSCIKPGFQYYLNKVNIEFYDIMRAFRGARLCCPVQVQGLQPTIESLELLRKFPFLDDDAIINGLGQELPNYLALSDGVQVQTEDDRVKWWARNASTLPKWAAVVRKILLVQPSSGAAERVFSLLNSTFSKGQETALEETVEASIMLKYNSTQRGKAQ